MNLSFRQNEDTSSTTVLGDDVFVIVITSVVLLTLCNRRRIAHSRYYDEQSKEHSHLASACERVWPVACQHKMSAPPLCPSAAQLAGAGRLLGAEAFGTLCSSSAKRKVATRCANVYSMQFCL